MKKLTKEEVAQVWFLGGLYDHFIAFQINSIFHWEPFIHSVGFEKICKAYLLVLNASEYENFPRKDAKEKINKLAKNRWGHKLQEMVCEIKTHVNDPNPESIFYNSAGKCCFCFFVR